jgi:hypothetical protein
LFFKKKKEMKKETINQEEGNLTILIFRNLNLFKKKN